MHAWEAIQKTIDYIENHIEEKITIEDLAKMASLSPFYYQRLFNRLVKKTVIEYIKLRRMAKALDELLDKDKRILDIAISLGFTSHAHFSRTFKDIFGITPDEYRKNPKIFNRMTKPQLLMSYTLIDEGVPLIVDDIVLEINHYHQTSSEFYIGLKKDIPVQLLEGLGIESGDNPLYQLWDSFHIQKMLLTDMDIDGHEIGVTYPSSQEGYFAYFVGGKSHTSLAVETYMTWELSKGEYIVCTFEAENFENLVMDLLYKAQQYLYNFWLPNHKLKTSEFCIEKYPSHNPTTTKMELWLKII